MTDTLRTPTPATSEWVTCPACKTILYGKRFARNQHVCPNCGRHARLTAHERLDQLLDPGSMTMLEIWSQASDPLGFVDTAPYPQRLRDARAQTGLDEAVICALGAIEGHRVAVAVMDFRFMGGSLGSTVGELITIAAETALSERVPLLLVTASGGARMQEGVLALMQMAKTSQALAALDEAGILTISIVTDPTYGGVAASFATLTDLIIAEPGARMGFAGPRVIEQTIRQTLPPRFQTAEFLLEHGLIDDVQPRAMLRPVLENLLAAQKPRRSRRVMRGSSGLIRRADELPVRDAWQTVQLARHIDRPTALDYISYLLHGFQELHGDRMAQDCPAIVGGVGLLGDLPVMVIGHQKGHNTRDLVTRNFGMSSPAGYRKAARLMRLAAKLHVPVITLIDTPGAYPGVEAEERGQAVAIAENLRLMSGLPVPIVAVITGEGGSGGALALGVADRVLACANAIYSVISPEGCAAILWKTPRAAPMAAEALRLDARSLLGEGIIEGVVPEPEGGAHRDHVMAAELLRDALTATLAELLSRSPEQRRLERHRRFRYFGANALSKGQEACA